MAKVSVVAPVYGVEKYIDQFLQSIREQTLQDIEVILVDDGSKDRCPVILDDFAQEDDRYIVIHQPNGGVATARNTGLNRVTGEYVYIIDSDDWLTPDALEKLYDAAKKHDADMVYGDWIREPEGGKSQQMACFPRPFVTSDPETIAMLHRSVFTNDKVFAKCPEFEYIVHFGGAPWRAMVRTSIIKDNKLSFDSYVRGMGDDILFTLNEYEYVHSIVYIQHPTYHYRVIEGSYTHGYKENYLETVERIYERMELFLEENNKDDITRKFYYYRVLLYLQQGMGRYFKNSQNPKDESELYLEFRKLMDTEPYKSARCKAPLHIIANKRKKLCYYMLRMGLYRIYWNVIKWKLRK